MTEEDEIFYHVFQRSFYDSNGDSHGDIPGLIHKLDYIQRLGVTSILMLPLYDSVYHHNYFANDFRAIDPKYGSLEDFRYLLKEVHARGMKLYLDMEVQYVAEDHPWFKDSLRNPESPFSDYILYNGPDNTEPETVIFNLSEVESYDGTVKKVACLNLYNKEVQEKITDEFLFWTDPLGDSSLRNGVDGFRLDHMMDDLDSKGVFTSLYTLFWKPLINTVKARNSGVRFMGEQGNWESLGAEAFTSAGVDMMFAFPLKFAISEMNADAIIRCHERGLSEIPTGKQQIIFLENHDTERFASAVQSDAGRLRAGAALNLLLSGTPMIYYGQELGMRGTGGFSKYGISDGNDIPRREAMPWYAQVRGPGMALWYEDSGPWWKDTELRNDDGVSVEEQEKDETSLLNFYRRIISIRKEYEILQQGRLTFVDVKNAYVVAFLRKMEDVKFLILVSLSSDDQVIEAGMFQVKRHIFPEKSQKINELPAYTVRVLELES